MAVTKTRFADLNTLPLGIPMRFHLAQSCLDHACEYLLIDDFIAFCATSADSWRRYAEGRLGRLTLTEPAAVWLLCQPMRIAFVRLLLRHVRWTGRVGPSAGTPSYLLRAACGQGALSTAQWIAEQFTITADQVRFDNNLILQQTCEHGRHEVAQWLVAHYGLTVADIRASGCLDGACAEGCLPVVQWIVTQFELPANEVCAMVYPRRHEVCALHIACKHGRLAVVQWLVAHFRLADATGLAWREYVELAISGDHLELVRWLAVNFQIQLTQFQRMCRYYLNTRLVDQGGQIEKWLTAEHQRMCAESAADMAEIAAKLGQQQS
jgi:hypothetical protein